MDNSGIPSQYRSSEFLSGAWEDGGSAADRDHSYAETYGGGFEGEPSSVPSPYAVDAESGEAFRDGYRVRAQDLIDGEF